MLPNINRPLSALTLVATGDVVLVLHDGAAFEAISGQEWVFEVARFERELADWQARSHRPQKASPAGEMVQNTTVLARRA